jgi:CheY-like chemotaxis protein
MNEMDTVVWAGLAGLLGAGALVWGWRWWQGQRQRRARTLAQTQAMSTHLMDGRGDSGLAEVLDAAAPGPMADVAAIANIADPADQPTAPPAATDIPQAEPPAVHGDTRPGGSAQAAASPPFAAEAAGAPGAGGRDPATSLIEHAMAAADQRAQAQAEAAAEHAALLAAYQAAEEAAAQATREREARAAQAHEARVAREAQAAWEAQARAAAEAAAQAQAQAAAEKARAEAQAAQARAEREANARALAERERAELQARLDAAAQEMATREAAARAREQALVQQRLQAEQLERAAAQARAEAEAQAQAQAQAEAEAQALAAALPTARQATDTLVMVVDDSKVVRVKTSRLLAKLGFQVALAEDGADALRQLASTWPQVLITDVEMPGVDGFELTRQVRAQAAGAALPIIMITSADDRLRDAAREAGVTVLMGKPYSDEGLLAQVATLSGVVLPAA